MTKEELAKKKGLKTQKNTLTAAEALITTVNEVKVEEPKVAKENKVEEPKAIRENKVEEPKIAKENKVKEPKVVKDTEKFVASQKKEEPTEPIDKNRVGRPKGKPSTRVSINLPIDALDYARFEAGMNYSANLSGYILNLIENDRKVNGAIYEQIKKNS